MPPKNRLKATPEEEKEVKAIVDKALDQAIEVESAPTSIPLEQEAEPKTKPDLQCVFCGRWKSEFIQPGKELMGKWVCPNCVQLV
jgi:hypothetical protein